MSRNLFGKRQSVDVQQIKKRYAQQNMKRVAEQMRADKAEARIADLEADLVEARKDYAAVLSECGVSHIREIIDGYKRLQAAEAMLREAQDIIHRLNATFVPSTDGACGEAAAMCRRIDTFLNGDSE